MHSFSRVLIALALSAFLLCACGRSDPSPGDLLPANLSKLDPKVISLIEQQMTRIESYSDSARSYAELGMIYEANTLWTDARRAWAVAVDLEPDQTWWRFHLAVASRESGNLEDALRLLQELNAAPAQTESQLAPVQQRLGEALAESSDLAGAAEAYRLVIELMPSAAEGYHGLGQVRLLQQDYAAARQLLERAVVLDSRYRAAHYSLGLAYRGLGMVDEAQIELARGVDAVPRYLSDPLTAQINAYVVNHPALRNRAASMLLSGRPDKAAELLEQILNDQPGGATDLNNLAIAYMRMGRFEEARVSLEKALRIAPEKFSTWLNLSSLATRTGDQEAALAYAEAAVERAPNLAQTHMSLAMAEAELGYLKRTAASLERAVRLDERDPQVHGMLAEVSVQLGRLELAEEHFGIVLTLLPDSLTGMLNLGQLYLQQGRLDDARELLARANKLAPGNARVTAFDREIRNYEPGEQK